MHESEPHSARGSSVPIAQLVDRRPNGHLHHRLRRGIKRHICLFGVAARALAEHLHKKPAAWLAHLIGGSERGAQHIIDGDRKVTAKAMHAIEGEMLD